MDNYSPPRREYLHRLIAMYDEIKPAVPLSGVAELDDTIGTKVCTGGQG